MGAIVIVLLGVFFAASYTIQNWILEVMDGLSSGVVFGSLLVVGALVPFILFVVSILAISRRVEG